MPDVTADAVNRASRELEQAWEARDWTELMNKEKSVRLLAEQTFADQLPEGELRDALMALQQQYLRIVEEIVSERNQLQARLSQTGNRLRAVRHYHTASRMKGNRKR